jgi:hypothetical protein
MREIIVTTKYADQPMPTWADVLAWLRANGHFRNKVAA